MYLDEGLSYHELSDVYGLLLDASTFNARGLKYQEHGIVGIQMKRRNSFQVAEKDSPKLLAEAMRNLPKEKRIKVLLYYFFDKPFF